MYVAPCVEHILDPYCIDWFIFADGKAVYSPTDGTALIACTVCAVYQPWYNVLQWHS